MLEFLFGFALAIALGGLVGIERAYHRQGGFAGTRTFILISFLGALSKFLSDITNSNYIFIIIIVIFALLVLASYIFSALKGFIGITTEITSLLTFILGALSMMPEYRNLAIIILVSIVTILTLKGGFEKIVKKTTPEELYDTLKFLIIAFVILPILPNTPLDHIISSHPLYLLMPEIVQQIIGNLNLHTIWLIIVLYAGTGFLGYILIKLLGANKGLTLNSFLGGLTSTFAVNNTLLEYSEHHNNKKAALLMVKGLMLSNIAMLIRVFVLVALISFKYSEKIIAPFVLIIGFNIILYIVLSILRHKTEKIKLNLQNPLNLRASLKFGGIFLIIIVLSQIFLNYLGDIGLYLVGILSGGFQVTGYILSIADLIENQSLFFTTAFISTAIVLISSVLIKGIYNIIKAKNNFARFSFYYYAASALFILFTFILFA